MACDNCYKWRGFNYCAECGAATGKTSQNWPGSQAEVRARAANLGVRISFHENKTGNTVFVRTDTLRERIEVCEREGIEKVKADPTRAFWFK